MEKIYFDNASTSFPKAPGVGDAVSDFLSNGAYNVNRGGYGQMMEVEEVVFATREKLNSFFNGFGTKNTVFTPSVTFSLNYVLFGLLREGDHVVTSHMEHNAVMRPLTELSKHGVCHTLAHCDSEGRLDLLDFEQKITPNTKLVVMTAASNVCGTTMPLFEVGQICKKHNIIFVVDSAQTAGVLPIDMQECNISVLCFTAHKGLLAAQGLGGFLIEPSLAKKMSPRIFGGTGSFSMSLDMPALLPDKFEAGTQNLPAIVSLNRSLDFVMKNMEQIHATEMALTERFINGMKTINGVKTIGIDGTCCRVATVSLDFPDLDNAEVSFALANEFGILTRCGLHCSPTSHTALGTYPHGTVRFSFSSFNTVQEVDKAIFAIGQICQGLA